MILIFFIIFGASSPTRGYARRRPSKPQCESQSENYSLYSIKQGSPQHSEDTVDPVAETQPAEEAEVMEDTVDPMAETQPAEEAEVDPEAETQLMGDSAVMDSQVDPEAETQAMETADTDSQGCLCWNKFLVTFLVCQSTCFPV